MKRLVNEKRKNNVLGEIMYDMATYRCPIKFKQPISIQYYNDLFNRSAEFWT